ncbi:MAG TPA: efflux RND transporter periplasmic adaptor subunit [Kofleriaceae bacterium]|nr:efflux RND transporter periplasmic adaptor subunit [Kofleriaceae bacterium]
MRCAWLLLLAIACRSGADPSEEEEETPPARVTCVAVTPSPLGESLVLRGRVAPPPLAEAVVASTVPGRIARLFVQEGDQVAAHDLVAQIEDPTLGASASTSSAEVDAARVELRSGTVERVRSERLAAQGIVPEKDVADARAREDAARANLRVAESRSGLARRQLARSDLRAPRSGTVLRVFKRAGEVVDGGNAAIAEIADLSALELRAQVTAVELVGLTPGAPAQVLLDAVPGRPLTGEVISVAPAVDPETSLGAVRVRLTLPAGWTPAVGLAGAATVTRPPHQALVVPAAALRRSLEGHDELLRCADGHAEVREVEIGVRAPAGVEVTKGLAAGDRVVVDHVLGIEDGAAIEEVR